jgi:hypothetical protein
MSSVAECMQLCNTRYDSNFQAVKSRRLGGASVVRRCRRGSTHEAQRERSERHGQRPACMRRALPGPDRNVACCAVVPGEQIVLEWANARKRLSSAWQATE